MSTERDILKSLLLKEELEVLAELKQKLLSEEQFTQEVSHVLAGAIKRARKKDPSFEKSLEIPIKKGVIKAFSESKQSIIDALLPIMGQLIRKSVANSIKQFVTDINRALETKFSIKTLKWRWQAKKAGKSYAEMLFQKTIRYQVTELFLISRENGLLIAHAGTEDSLKDNNAISAMLTVIQDFISDSFKQGEANLQSVIIQDMVYIITSGPSAYLASVVKGSPTERLNEKTQELIENIHSEFSSTLVDDSQFLNNEELSDYLRKHLVAKSISEEKKQKSFIVWYIVLGLLIAALSYWLYVRNRSFNEAFEIIESTPGFYLQTLKRQDGGFLAKGLLDPQANIENIKKANIALETKPYASLEKSIVEKRVELILTQVNSEGANAKLSGNKVILSGKATKETAIRLASNLLTVIGVDEVVNKLSYDHTEEVKSFLIQFPGINVREFSGNRLIVEGNVFTKQLEKFELAIKKAFPQITVDTSKVTLKTPSEQLIQQINAIELLIPDLSKIQEQHEAMQIVINNLQTLRSRGSKIALDVIGESDCFGRKSDYYSLNRAKKVVAYLINHGLDEQVLKGTVNACVNFNKGADNSKLKVSFKVKQ